eukprot:jgi/Tetstr1/466471/TSEL_000980.t1
MAASSTAQPPGVVKTLTDDKKRKRPVKKRRGKKLTVAESEAESEAQAEAEAERGGGSEIVEAEAPHMTAATATVRWTTPQTDNGELEVACSSKGAAEHEISSPDTSKAAAPGVPAKRPPRPTPLKAPGSDAEEV